MDENSEFYYPYDLVGDLELANATAFLEALNCSNNKDEDEEMINEFLNEQKSRNTEYKTKSNMKTWQRFCQSIQEKREIQNIPEAELEKMLCKFLSPFASKMALSTNQALYLDFREVFNAIFKKKALLSTY